MMGQARGGVVDAVLIERSWREPTVFAALYERHAAEIFRFVARRVGDQAADDAVAETFLAAFRRREGYDLLRADARPWLFGIAVNVIGKHRRSERRLLRALARSSVGLDADDGLDQADDRIVATSARSRLAAALASLSRRTTEMCSCSSRWRSCRMRRLPRPCRFLLGPCGRG